MTACTQPGCIGTIVDGYCDVCGSPPGAVPFVPAEAASAGSPTLSDEPGPPGWAWRFPRNRRARAAIPPVRSRGVRARSWTVTAMSAAVQQLLSRSCRPRQLRADRPHFPANRGQSGWAWRFPRNRRARAAVRSRGVRARPWTVTAMSAAVQGVLSRSCLLRQRLQWGYPPLPPSLAQRQARR
jgi:hypothetical protein